MQKGELDNISDLLVELFVQGGVRSDEQKKTTLIEVSKLIEHSKSPLSVSAYRQYVNLAFLSSCFENTHCAYSAELYYFLYCSALNNPDIQDFLAEIGVTQVLIHRLLNNKELSLDELESIVTVLGTITANSVSNFKLICREELVTYLLLLVEKHRSVLLTIRTLNTLGELARKGIPKQLVLDKTDTITTILPCLRDSDYRIRQLAVVVLESMVKDNPSNQDLVVRIGMSYLLPLLDDTSTEVKEITLWTFWHLSKSRKNKHTIVSRGALTYLVPLATNNANQNLDWAADNVLIQLSNGCQENMNLIYTEITGKPVSSGSFHGNDQGFLSIIARLVTGNNYVDELLANNQNPMANTREDERYISPSTKVESNVQWSLVLFTLLILSMCAKIFFFSKKIILPSPGRTDTRMRDPRFLLEKLIEEEKKVDDAQEEHRSVHVKKMVVDTISNQAGVLFMFSGSSYGKKKQDSFERKIKYS